MAIVVDIVGSLILLSLRITEGRRVGIGEVEVVGQLWILRSHSLAKLADLVGIKGANEEEKAKAFIAEIYAMNERMGIPKGFHQIQEKDIPIIVERALKEGNPLYPVPVIYGEEEMTAIVKSLMIKE